MFGCCMLAVARLAGKVGGLTEVFFTGLCEALPAPKGRAAIFLFVVVMIAVLGCGGRKTGYNGNSKTEGIITMTTASQEVSFMLRGLGTATIDWGDGSQPETEEISRIEFAYFQHSFSNTKPRTITITGENITGLRCMENQITKLDISKNTLLTGLWCYDNKLTELDASKNRALKELYVENNLFTIEALNDLFQTLPSNDFIKSIFINNNPGSAGCDPSIAEEKGWRIDEIFYGIVDVKPLFDGKDAEEEFRKFVNENKKYPPEALENDISGRVFVEFIIEIDGSISNVRILRALDPLLDAEVLRVVKSSPKWTQAGVHNGKTVRVSYQFPFIFMLE